MATIGKLTAYLGLNTAELQGDMTRAQAMFTRFSAAGTKSLGAIAASAGKLSAAFAGLGIAIGGGMLLRSIDQIGTDFEQTMATVGGVMRATSEELAALTESARRMGETTEWTASQAGESLKYLGMAGFDAQQAMEALPGTLDLATAGNLDLGRAADIATNALTAMQLPISELGRVNDVFVGTITRSNVNMEEMAEAFKYAAPSAKAFGYSIEELAGMIGMLGNAGIKGCYDDQTEVLTRRGWIHWSQAKMRDEFATLNPDTNEIEYQKPIQLIRYRHNGKMSLVQNRNINLCVTPDHRMWVKRRGRKDYGVMTAEKVFGKTVRYQAGGMDWTGDDPTTYTLKAFKQNRGNWAKAIKNLTIDAGLWAEFLGWYISEGSCKYHRGNYSVIISQRKEHNRDKIRALLKKLPWNFCECKDQFKITSEQLYREIHKLGKQPVRFIPEYAKNWSPRLLEILLLALIDGDGDQNGVYYTSSPRLANDVQEIALKLGYAGMIGKHGKAGEVSNYDKEGRSITATYDQLKVNIRKKQLWPWFMPSEYTGEHGKRLNGDRHTIKNEWIDYDGEVFCAEVPNHLLIVRRGGKAIVSGNSMAGTQLSMAMLQAQKTAAKFGYSSSDLIDVLQSMAAEGRNSMEVLDAFGIRAGKAGLVLQAMGKETRDFQETLGGVAGEAQRLADAMRKTIGGAKKALGSIFESIKIDVFEVFRDDLRDTIIDITEWLRENREGIVGFANILFDAFKPIASVLGLVTEGFAGLISVIGSLSGQSFESFMSTSKAMEEQQEKALKLADRYDKLAGKTNLNASEQEKLKGIVADLARLYPGMVTEVDKYGKALSINTNLLRNEIEMQKALQTIRETRRLKDIKDSYDDLYSSRYENIKAMQHEYEYLSRQYQAAKNTVARLVDAGQKGSSAYWELTQSAERYSRQMESMRDRIAETSNAQDALMIQASAMLPGLTKGTEQWKLAVQSLGEEFVNMVLLYQQGLNTIASGTEKMIESPMGWWDIEGWVRKAQKLLSTFKPTQPSALIGLDETAQKLLDTQVNVYRDLLSETGRTTQQLEAVWDGYKSARIEQIVTEADEMYRLGLSANDVVSFVNKSMRDLNRDWQDLFGSNINRELIDTQASLYRDMVYQQGQSQDEMLRAWGKYKEARIQQIEDEAKQLEAIGASADMVKDYVNNAMRDMNEEQKRIFGDHGEWLRNFMQDVAQDMRSIMNDFFFDTIKGDFVKLTDYLEAIWDSFLRAMATKATDEFMNLIGLGQKQSAGGGFDLIGGIAGAIGGLFGGGGGTESSSYNRPGMALASGGIVTSPTIAQIGEVPEAVIPLDKLRDENFMRSLGYDGPREKDQGDVYVNFHIQTPDPPSFKASQKQLLTQAAIAMRQARRNI